MGSNNSTSKKSLRSIHSDSTNISNRLNNMINSSVSRDHKKFTSTEYKSSRRREAIEYFNSLKNTEVYCIEKSNLNSKLNNPIKLIKLNDCLINQLCQNYFDKQFNSDLPRATIGLNLKGENYSDFFSNFEEKSQRGNNQLKNKNFNSETLKEVNSFFSECESLINASDNFDYEISKENSNYSTNYTAYESQRHNINVTRIDNRIKIDLRSLLKDSNSQTKQNKFFKFNNNVLETHKAINPKISKLNEAVVKLKNFNLNPKKL